MHVSGNITHAAIPSPNKWLEPCVVAPSDSSPLSQSELAELDAAFTYVTNYDSDDPTEKIDPLTYRAPDGDTCLHIAAHRGNLRAVELLIKAGLDINYRGTWATRPCITRAHPRSWPFCSRLGPLLASKMNSVRRQLVGLARVVRIRAPANGSSDHGPHLR
jgi:hypothetical protein